MLEAAYSSCICDFNNSTVEMMCKKAGGFYKSQAGYGMWVVMCMIHFVALFGISYVIFFILHAKREEVETAIGNENVRTRIIQGYPRIKVNFKSRCWNCPRFRKRSFVSLQPLLSLMQDLHLASAASCQRSLTTR